jgi:hypothetical protein
VLITPHVSGGSDLRQHRGVDLFGANPFGDPLRDVLDPKLRVRSGTDTGRGEARCGAWDPRQSGR